MKGPIALVVAISAGMTALAGGSAFRVEGTYVEACTCMPPCGCEIVGLEKGCEGVGATEIKSGSFGGVSLSGCKTAYATVPGEWVRIYIDAKSPAQRKAAEGYSRGVLSAFGKIESVSDAKISFSGSNGKYTVMVDGGKVMKFSTEPVLGADKRTAVAITNVNDPINKTFYQGKAVMGEYHDGGTSFTIYKGNNSFFNDKMKASGKL
jgi:hypothetical protein